MLRIIAVLSLLATTAAHAQMYGSGTTQVGGTIAVTNTFQTVLAANTNRKGCLFQNKGTNAMLVYFGVLGDATAAKSYSLPAGAFISCAQANIVITSGVNVTGTAADTYVISNQ